MGVNVPDVVFVPAGRLKSTDVTALAIAAAGGLDLAVRELSNGHKDLARTILADVRAVVLRAEKALR